MGLFGRKEKKKKTNRGKFERLEVGGKALPVLNFYLFTAKEDGERYIELTALEELPELHFSEVEMTVILSTKKLAITANFVDAFPKGRFKVYKFKIADIREFYI